MQKFNRVNSINFLLLILAILFFGISCYYSTTSLRLFNGDGGRAMVALLGNPYPFVEKPYFRVANVLVQWPYLVVANLIHLEIEEARLWIAFSYSSMPLFVLLFFGIESFNVRSSRWFWAALGLICISYLPQAFNAFNTVVETSFLFLIYLFVDTYWTGYRKNLSQIFLIVFFVCSHETSLVYTGFIAVKPVVDHFFQHRKISLRCNWISCLGIIGSIGILFRYFRLPPQDHLNLKAHFEVYLSNPDLRVTLSFIFFCCAVSFRRSVIAALLGALFVYLLLTGVTNPGWIESFHYAYRLITPLLTIGWCLLVFYRTPFLDLKVVQYLLMTMLVFFSARDIGISKRWSHAMEKFKEYSADKPICYTEKDPEVLVYLRKFGCFDRVMGVQLSLGQSPSYDKVQLIFLPDPAALDFDPCKHVDKFSVPYTFDGRYGRFYYRLRRKFNWKDLEAYISN